MQRFYPPKIRKDSEDIATSDLSSVPYIPWVRIEEIAQRIFEDNFSIMNGSCKVSMESAIGQSSPASLGGTSLGLAALAVMRKDPQIMHLARKRYCSALQLLARAVQEPIQSNAENSVAAGFILSMFEVAHSAFTSFVMPDLQIMQVIVREKSLISSIWLQHAYGTAALLSCLCSWSQVPKDHSRALLDVSYTSVCCVESETSLVFELIAFDFQSLASLISGKPVPQMFLHLAENCEPDGGDPIPNDPVLLSIQLCSVMSSLVNLHASAKQTSQYSQDQLFVLATTGDKALEAWAASLPSSWAYQTFPNHPRHVYGSPWFARTWNYYRLSRILANKIILNVLNAGSFSSQTMNHTLINEYKVQNDRSASLISELLQEIYTSLPTIFDFDRVGTASIPLSLDVFFAVTILQSLVVLIGKSTLLQNWPPSACEQGEEKFAILKDIMIRNLL